MCCSESLSLCQKKSHLSSTQTVSELRRTHGCGAPSKAGVESNCVRGDFAEERPVWAPSVSLGSRPGTPRRTCRSAVGKINLLPQKHPASRLWWFLRLGSECRHSAAASEGGRTRKVKGCDRRGRRGKGRYDERRFQTSHWHEPFRYRMGLACG